MTLTKFQKSLGMITFAVIELRSLSKLQKISMGQPSSSYHTKRAFGEIDKEKAVICKNKRHEIKPGGLIKVKLLAQTQSCSCGGQSNTAH